ncbi:MAG: secondary thiamine-phosphate synthase enzyme YjbQ [Nitrospirota bacterium]|nr:secondary thiamine-phosphate synthase enzyme YjbQ [Nitrospirota bacterium]
MAVWTHSLQASMDGDSHIQNLTQSMQEILSKSGIMDGTLTLFVKHTTASVMIIEDEPGIRADTRNFWNQTIPANPQWEHNTKNPGEDNGHSHLRGQLQGPSLTVPIVHGSLTLGTWQQIVLIDFDTRARTRDLVVQIMGE